jgi:hypothetical protein
MPTPKVPPGPNRVALGQKDKEKKRKEWSAVHKPGTETHVSTVSSGDRSLTPKLRAGGNDAKVRQ